MNFEQYWAEEARPRLLRLKDEFGIEVKEEELPVFELLALRSYNIGYQSALDNMRLPAWKDNNHHLNRGATA